MIEEDMKEMVTQFKELRDELRNKMNMIVLKDEESEELCRGLSSFGKVIGIKSTVLCSDAGDDFYKGTVAISRAVKKPGKVLNDLVNELSVEDKEVFLETIKPAVKRFIKDEQDWEDFMLSFAEKIKFRHVDKKDD